MLFIAFEYSSRTSVLIQYSTTVVFELNFYECYSFHPKMQVFLSIIRL